MRGLGIIVGVIVIVAAIAFVVSYNGADQGEADQLPLPDRTYSAATFDTVVWADPAAATARGKDVYAWVCAKCHGPTGLGDGGEVIDGDTLHPPSFVNPAWRFAQDEAGLQQRIYLGNNRGMPHWGEQGLQPRDVVAVSRYILQDLRAAN